MLITYDLFFLVFRVVEPLYGFKDVCVCVCVFFAGMESWLWILVNWIQIDEKLIQHASYTMHHMVLTSP